MAASFAGGSIFDELSLCYAVIDCLCSRSLVKAVVCSTELPAAVMVCLVLSPSCHGRLLLLLLSPSCHEGCGSACAAVLSLFVRGGIGRSVMVGLGSCGWWAPMLVALAGGGGGRRGAVVCWWCAWLLARGLAQTRRVTAALHCLNRLFPEKAMLKSKAAKPVTEFAEKDADDISAKVPSHHDTMSVASRSSWGQC